METSNSSKLTIDKTKKIWEQITLKSWFKGTYYKINETTREIEAMCSISWIAKRYGSLAYTEKLEPQFKQAIQLPDGISIARWNDDPKRKFHEVQQAFKKADL